MHPQIYGFAAVQYLRSTSLTARLSNVGHDREVWQTTRRVRSVVPSTHSTSPVYSSCHQPRSPPPLCSASCHPDSHAQASDVIRSHRPLGLRWGPFTCPQRRHRRPAEGVETTSRSSSSNMAAYCVNSRIWGCGRPGTELTTGNSGVISWKQRRSSRGMLHDDAGRNRPINVEKNCGMNYYDLTDRFFTFSSGLRDMLINSFTWRLL